MAVVTAADEEKEQAVARLNAEVARLSAALAATTERLDRSEGEKHAVRERLKEEEVKHHMESLKVGLARLDAPVGRLRPSFPGTSTLTHIEGEGVLTPHPSHPYPSHTSHTPHLSHPYPSQNPHTPKYASPILKVMRAEGALKEADAKADQLQRTFAALKVRLWPAWKCCL